MKPQFDDFYAGLNRHLKNWAANNGMPKHQGMYVISVADVKRLTGEYGEQYSNTPQAELGGLTPNEAYQRLHGKPAPKINVMGDL